MHPPQKKETNKQKKVDSFKVASHARRDNVEKQIFYSRKIDLTPIFVRKNIVPTRSYGQNSVLFTYCH